MSNTVPAYDIVGDIHGHADELKLLLSKLGYTRHHNGFRHAERKLVFVGDFVDRGPAIREVIQIARTMVDAGDALAVMGNHEYNAIAFHTARPDKQGEWFRPHSDRNLKQHHATLTQLSPPQLADSIAWFKTLPVAIEVDGMRVVHASWQKQGIDCINQALNEENGFSAEFLAVAETAGSDLHAAIESVLKGPELELPDDLSFKGKGGELRKHVRYKWYQTPAGRTYRDYHLGSDEVPDVAIEPTVARDIAGYSRDAPPVFVGHYWLTGTPTPLAANIACTDYSVAKGGKLVAYRWDGETELKADKFCWVESQNQ